MEQLAKRSILSEKEKACYMTVGKRSTIAREVYEQAPYYEQLHAKSEQEWLQLDQSSYQALETLTRDIYEATRSQYVQPEHEAGATGMNVDFDGLVRHIRVMQGVLGAYWDEGLQNLFPEGTTREYLNALCIKHDFFRFANVNGPLPLEYTDRVSDTKLSRFFPHSPASIHLHNMAMITGVEAEPESPLPYIMKLADTCGKPNPRFPDVFFAPGQGYDQWLTLQQERGSLPFYALKPGGPHVNREEKIIYIDAEQYKNADIQLTMKGLTLLQEVAPHMNFNTVLQNVTEEIAADPFVAQNFGK